MNISYSKVELFSTCGMKYKFRYIDRYDVDKTFSPLLFGTAIDKSLNYVLTRKKHNHEPYIDTAKLIFLKYMRNWYGQNELVFFKNEAPEGYDQHDAATQQQLVWDNLCSIGQLMIDTYVKDVLPHFKQIMSVQTKRKIANESGDTLVLITDFSAKLHDGRVVVFDNKTSSNINQYYGPDSVKKSQQLAIYSEFEENNVAGYIALQKKLVRGKIKWNMIIDQVPEEQVEAAFNKIDGALAEIKSGEFIKNKTACYSFYRKCEYFDLCHFGNDRGLIKK